MIDAVLFDLDYTLHDMRRYLRGAYRDVARAVAEEPGTPDAGTLFATLWRVWEDVGTDYGFLFNDWLDGAGLFSEARLRRCIDVFHEHQPHLALYPGLRALLGALRNDYRLGLVTDGHAGMQRRKVAALALEDIFDVIVYTADRHTSKPDPAVFDDVLEQIGVVAGAAVYVGDHPERDVAGAHRAGLIAVRVLTGEFRGVPDDPSFPSHARLERLSELPAVLARLGAEAKAC